VHGQRPGRPGGRPHPGRAKRHAPGLPQPTETLDLWPDGSPGHLATPLVETVNERSTDRLVNDRAVLGIMRPRMAVFRPDRPNGAAVMITPGGGYRWIVVDKEGYEIGRWLAARGLPPSCCSIACRAKAGRAGRIRRWPMRSARCA
jgi:hypothetical protein